MGSPAVRAFLNDVARSSHVGAVHAHEALTPIAFERTIAALENTPAEVRPHLLRAIHMVAESLGHGDAVTLSRHEATVTTQEAADVLGISRPTLVRLLEQGAIPFSQPSRHRRMLLADVLAYQASHDGIHQTLPHDEPNPAGDAPDAPTR